MAKNKPISFSFSDRTIVIGGTGSGKTTISKKLINLYYNASRGLIPIYIIDTKLFPGEFDDYERKGIGHGIFDIEKAPDPFIPDNEKGSVMVWHCPIVDETDDGVFGQFFTKVFEAAQQGQPALIFIDELSSFTSQSGKRYAKSLQLIYTQGRALNLSVICCTQFISNFPKIVLTQSSKAIRMALNDEYDIRKLSRIMGKAVEQPPKSRFGFWYKDLMIPVASSPPVEFKDHKEFFGN